MRALQNLARTFRPPAPRCAPPPPPPPQLAGRRRSGPSTPPPTNPLRRPQTTRRTYSTGDSNPNPHPNPPNPNASTATRAERILSRLPRPLQRYAARLRGAPVTHVVAFLILHEITAVVPLLGLFGLFHYTEHAPVAYMLEHYAGYVRDGVRRFERYFRRKGWFGFGRGGGDGDGDGEGARAGAATDTAAPDGRKGDEEVVLERWQGDPRYRVVVEVALAYALTKVLLPVRIVASVWATPWFAGVLMRLKRVVGRGG